MQIIIYKGLICKKKYLLKLEKSAWPRHFRGPGICAALCDVFPYDALHCFQIICAKNVQVI